jgi:hypothetical protein
LCLISSLSSIKRSEIGPPSRGIGWSHFRDTKLSRDGAREALSPWRSPLFGEFLSTKTSLHDALLSTERCSPRRPPSTALSSPRRLLHEADLSAALFPLQRIPSRRLSLLKRMLGLPHQLFTRPLGRSEEVSGSSILSADQCHIATSHPNGTDRYVSTLLLRCGT